MDQQEKITVGEEEILYRLVGGRVLSRRFASLELVIRESDGRHGSTVSYQSLENFYSPQFR